MPTPKSCCNYLTYELAFAILSILVKSLYFIHNSFAVFFVTCQMILSVLLFAFDRLFVLKKVARYLSLPKGKLNLVIIFSWFISVSFSVPLVAGLKSMPYRQRYSCSIADPRDDIYMAVAFATFIAVPAVILLYICISSILTFHREKKKQTKMKGQTYSYLDQLLMIPYYRTELYSTLCMLALTFLCLILWFPYGGLITMEPILTEHWLNKTFDESHEFQDHYIESGASGSDLDFEDNSLAQNVTEYQQANMTNHVHYIPEMSETPVYETVFIWFRFIKIPFSICILNY